MLKISTTQIFEDITCCSLLGHVHGVIISFTIFCIIYFCCDSRECGALICFSFIMHVTPRKTHPPLPACPPALSPTVHLFFLSSPVRPSVSASIRVPPPASTAYLYAHTPLSALLSALTSFPTPAPYTHVFIQPSLRIFVCPHLMIAAPSTCPSARPCVRLPILR